MAHEKVIGAWQDDESLRLRQALNPSAERLRGGIRLPLPTDEDFRATPRLPKWPGAVKCRRSYGDEPVHTEIYSGYREHHTCPKRIASQEEPLGIDHRLSGQPRESPLDVLSLADSLAITSRTASHPT